MGGNPRSSRGDLHRKCERNRSSDHVRKRDVNSVTHSSPKPESCLLGSWLRVQWLEYSSERFRATFADGATFSFSADIALYAQWVAIPVVHVATFFENSNVLDSVSAFLSESVPAQLTSFASLHPTFSNPGYSFNGWNTEANGSGTTFVDGSTYSFSADIALYAQWVVITVDHTVTFNENDTVLDTVFSNESASSPTSLTSFASLHPTFSNPGYSFNGWNTEANGSGTTYEDGTNFAFASNVSLFAQWTALDGAHTVTFNENDSAMDLSSSQMTESSSTHLTLFVNIRPAFQNDSEAFVDWNTARDGSGTSYSDGAQFSFGTDLQLYAQWSLITLDTFTFSANGGDGTVPSIIGSPGTNLTVPGQAGLIRSGYVLTNWNTSANGSGSKYLVGEKVTITGSVDLYAQWSGHSPATLFGAIGTFRKNSSLLSASLKSQVNRIANTIRSRKYVKVDLFGYTAATGLKSFDLSLSRTRARNVATYLRGRLHALNVRGVTVLSTGDGSIIGQSSNAAHRNVAGSRLRGSCEEDEGASGLRCDPTN